MSAIDLRDADVTIHGEVSRPPAGRAETFGSAAMTVGDRRYFVALMGVGLCILALLFVHLFMPVDAVYDVTGHPIGRDFLNVWGAPRVAAAHGAAALGDLARYPGYLSEALGHALHNPFNWSYPPHALILLAPFSAPPYLVGFALWTLAGLLAFAAAVAAGLPRGERAFGLTIALGSPAAIWCLITGQNGLLIGAGFLAALLCLDRRPVVAGVLFGLLTVKPHLGLLVPVALLAMGAWRAIAAATLTTLALAALALVAFGVEPWRLWMTTTAAYQLSLVENIGDPARYLASMHHIMMASIAVSGYIAQLPPALTWTLQGAGAVVGAAAVWLTFRSAADTPTRSLVLLLATMLATPYVFNYDFLALTGALLWTVARPGASVWERAALGMAYLLPAAIVALHFFAWPLAPLVLLAVLALMVRRALAGGAKPIMADPIAAAS